MNPKLKDANVEYLYRAVLSLQNIEECDRFFDDLCTVQELKALSQRLQVAKMLRDHQVYSEIVQATGASTATISRVNRCLQYGDGGYVQVLKKQSAEAEA